MQRDHRRYLRYIAAFMVMIGIALWLTRRSREGPTGEPETGGRAAFHAFLKATDGGMPVSQAIHIASPGPERVSDPQHSECAVLYRWNFTASGSDYGTACVNGAGKVISTGGGTRFEFRSF